MEIRIIYLCAIIFGLGFLITLATVPLSIKLARRINAIDIPKDERRVHKRPVPRIGGVGIYLGVTISLIICTGLGIFNGENVSRIFGIAKLTWNVDWIIKGSFNPTLGVVLGGTVIFVAGLIDDVKQLSPRIKLLGQITAATIVFFTGVRVEFVLKFFPNDTALIAQIACYLATVLWIVAITNTINLIDGLDGLAAGISAIASLAIAYIAYIFGYYMGVFPMIAVAAGALGFLPYNFYPAKTFMGDCGSQYLGFIMACFSVLGSVKGATVIAVLIPSIALLLPILDTILAILRRALNGKPIMEADKGHLHHRLLRSGMGQRRTVICMYGVCGIMSTAAVLLSRGLKVETTGLLGIAILYIYVVLTDPNKKAPEIKKKKKKD